MTSRRRSSSGEPLHMQEIDDAEVPLLSEGEASRIGGNGSQADLYVRVSQPDPKVDYGKYVKYGKGLDSKARIQRDGSILVTLKLKENVPDLPPNYAKDVKEFAVDRSGWREFPRMSIVIMIVGSDVQPYVALGRRLVQDGHRIRIASHRTFQSFVEEQGLEFFDIGGDPRDLMSYMVKNPGLIPGIESLTNGDISKKRKMLAEMIDGCWRSCHLPCPQTGRTFAADAIISNPPAFAHIHCAEALGIPLSMSFTMPWSPTTAFSHPLVNIEDSNAQRGLTNYLSYALADILTWQGIGDIVNKFRERIKLKPLSLRSGPSLVDTVKVPWTYCMSPALIPKPNDWKNHIDVVGFYFLDLATSYTPADDLQAFLDAGEPPIYVGFGSVVVEDAAAMTRTVFEATKQAGVRALVSAGWGGLGGVQVPPHVFILGNIPHDWLFDKGRVSAVVHHGGAGTTAIGLSKGLPTVVVPFFGDQAFWGHMIHKAGAGPEPIHHEKLGIENLRDAIKFAMSPSTKAAATRLADRIRSENGVTAGVESFYKHLPLKNMRCDLDPSRLAVWWSTEHCLKLSAFAVQTLVDAGKLDLKSLDLHRTKEYETKSTITDPLTGGVSAVFWTCICLRVVKIVSSVYKGFVNLPQLYGTEIRQSGPVTDFSSGLKEAGKGLYYGYYDGITGLVREPVKGAKKEGILGAIKGSARSCGSNTLDLLLKLNPLPVVNATMLPAAGIVGTVKHPMKGAIKSVQALINKDKEGVQFNTRVSDGIEAVKSSTQSEREAILRLFEDAKPGAKERQERLVKVAEDIMLRDLDTPQTTSSSSISAPSPYPQTPLDHNLAHVNTGQYSHTEYDDEAFEQDLALAKQLSLADH
ncbi:glycosyltransferase family 1 protein [Moniliophthora roreri]|nr:glycosyltransferase family 1 protein [Moniliophthora roreri]